MANATYDAKWQQAMGELGEQLEVEGVGEEESGDAKELEECYDCMVHPQKRIAVKNILELVIKRVLELKADLVKWNPPNSALRMPAPNPEESFPWEYVHLDDILVDLKLSPEMLEIPIPRYFREDQRREIEEGRDRIVLGLMRTAHHTDKLFIPDMYDSAVLVENMTLERALDIIQRNERGRQGAERAAMVRTLREKERQGRIFEASTRMEMDSDIAATNLQRMMKGFISRTEAARERENELMFVGMRGRKDNVDLYENELKVSYIKRKMQQQENKESYEKALEDLKAVIADEEGPEKREELREERILWLTDLIARGQYPDDFEAFDKAKDPNRAETADDKAGAKDGKGGKDDKKGDKKGSKDDKKGKKEEKGKKGKKGEADDAEAMPKLQGRTEITDGMSKGLGEFEEIWENRDESNNFQQKYDTDLAKQVVRPGVYDVIKSQVQTMLLENLSKLRKQLDPKFKESKKGKGKGKGKGKKGKGGKGGKKKPLPGEKLADVKAITSNLDVLKILVECQLIVRVRDRTISSLIGDFNYLGSVHHNADCKDPNTWTPEEPSIAQLRQLLTEYCILPNGSSDVKATAKNLIKSVMLYGPAGTGKTHAVEAVANELGGLLIHLSPAKMRALPANIFGGKNGSTKLIHFIFMIARDPVYQPVVIYIDECEQFFTGGKKNKDKDGPSKFKKDLNTYKNQALTNEHRVIIIGTTKNPENGEMKDLKSFFDKFLYMPYPDYCSRVLIWKHYLAQKIREGLKQPELDATGQAKAAPVLTAAQRAAQEEELTMKVQAAMERVDVSSLAYVSEGYSAGAIARTVRIVVTHRRVAMIRLRPLSNHDFIDNLSFQDANYQDDRLMFSEFTKSITGITDRLNRNIKLLKGEKDGKKGDKKGGKKK